MGASQARKVDVRVIAATSRDLSQMVADNQFREDLYYRLNVLPVEMPPLRNRSEDIPLLCQHLIQKLNKTLGGKVKGIVPKAMAQMLQYGWPGNVRELENAIERAMVLSESNMLPEESFVFGSVRKPLSGSVDQVFDGFSMKSAQKVLEKAMITKALKATEGNRTQAARLLEISHPSLLSKIKRYQIDL